jgi:hypothetical protein
MPETTLANATLSSDEPAISAHGTISATKSVGHPDFHAAQWSMAWAPALVISALLVLLYHGIAVKLVTDWYDLPDFSHGFLIPFFAAFLLCSSGDLAQTFFFSELPSLC